jgi:hypothetical protein
MGGRGRLGSQAGFFVPAGSNKSLMEKQTSVESLLFKKMIGILLTF